MPNMDQSLLLGSDHFLPSQKAFDHRVLNAMKNTLTRMRHGGMPSSPGSVSSSGVDIPLRINVDRLEGLVMADDVKTPIATGANYWVSPAILDSSTSDLLFVSLHSIQPDRTVTVFNLDENVTRAHDIPEDTIVEFWGIYQNTGEERKRWVMRVTPPPVVVWVKIIGSVQFAANKFIYTGLVQVVGANSLFENKLGPTGQPISLTQIRNTVEAYNLPNPSIRGNSVDSSVNAGYPSTYAMRPIRGNPVLQTILDTSSNIWWVSYVNADQGVCP